MRNFVLILLALFTLNTFAQSVSEGGKAFKFDGVDDYIHCDTILNKLTIPFTFSAWVYKDSSDVQPFFSSNSATDTTSGNYSGFQVDISTGITLIYGNNSGDSSKNYRGITNTDTIKTNEWTHISVSVFNKDSIVAYINGLNAGGDIFGSLDTTQMVNIDNGIAEIGKRPYDTTSYFKGMVDEIRIWKYGQTQSEIRTQRCTVLTGNEDSLVACWDFNIIQNDSIFEMVTANKSAIINPDSSNNLEYLVDITPNGSFWVEDRFYCDNDTNPKLTVAGSNIRWYSDSLFSDSIGIGNYHIFNDSLMADSPAFYHFYIIDSLAWCSARYDTLTIEIRKSPQLPIVGDTAICFGDTLPFLVSDSNSIANWYFSFSPDSSLCIGDTIILDSVLTKQIPDSIFIFLIENDSINGCSSLPDSSFFKIKKIPQPEVSNQVLCERSDSLPKIEAIGEGVVKWFSDTDTSYVGEGNSLELSNYHLHANYFLMNDSLEGCTSDYELVVLTINPTPYKPRIINTNPEACEGEQTIILRADSVDSRYGGEPTWPDQNITGLELEVDASGTYSLKVKNLPGCFDTVSIEVEFLDCSCEITIPNVFTPNGDGVNETLMPDIKCEFLNEAKFEMKVYNRWGKKVFQTNDNEAEWNGLRDNDGPECPTGVYYYTLRYQNEKNEEEKTEKQGAPIYLHRGN